MGDFWGVQSTWKTTLSGEHRRRAELVINAWQPEPGSRGSWKSARVRGWRARFGLDQTLVGEEGTMGRGEEVINYRLGGSMSSFGNCSLNYL